MADSQFPRFVDPTQNTLPNRQGVAPLPPPNFSLPARSLTPTAPTLNDSDGQPQPGVIVRGRIVAAMPALNMYDVLVAGMGRIVAQYVSTAAGSNIFRPTTTQTTTLNAGTEVWVAVDPVNNVGLFIIGVAHLSAPLESNSRTLSQYPQVAGLEMSQVGSGTSSSPEQLDAKIGQGAGTEFGLNFNPGRGDAVSGDWDVTNFKGGGVGVEAFRVWISGGPMVGITLFCDEEMTRVMGSNFELITMAEEYEDKIMGRSLVSIRRRVDFPSDSLQDNPPNLLETRGQTYVGESSFRSYRPKDNPDQINSGDEDPPNTMDPQRSALMHEYRGTDGTYILTAAGSITLQKWAGVLMPTEIISRPKGELVKDYPSVVGKSDAEKSTLEFPAPEKDVPERLAVTGEEDAALLSGDAIQSPSRLQENPLQGAANVGDIVAGIIGYQSSRAFMNTSMWKIATGQMPGYLADPVDKTIGRPLDEINSDPGMWKRVPKFFVVNLNSYGASKRFYIGRAMISLTDEGGIVLQDAWGSQIMMVGGNIFMSAEHSIIRNAGRDNVDLSGRDQTVTAGRNVEVFASGGRAAVVAGSQLTLVGGNSGDHGVLIQSKGVGSSMLLNGEDDKYAASNGGVVIRSEGGITAAGKALRFAALDGSVGIKGKGGLLVETGDMSAAFTPTGMWLTDPAIQGGVMLSPYGSAMPLLAVTTNLVVYGMSNMLTNSLSTSAYAGSDVLLALRENIGALTPPDASPEATDALKPGFLSSEDYGSEASGFSIPEAAWQTRIRKAAKADETSTTEEVVAAEGDGEGDTAAATGGELQATCVWNINTVSGSIPSPGNSYWTDKGVWQVNPVYLKNGDNYNAVPNPAIVSAPLTKMVRGI